MELPFRLYWPGRLACRLLGVHNASCLGLVETREHDEIACDDWWFGRRGRWTSSIAIRGGDRGPARKHQHRPHPHRASPTG